MAPPARRSIERSRRIDEGERLSFSLEQPSSKRLSKELKDVSSRDFKVEIMTSTPGSTQSDPDGELTSERAKESAIVTQSYDGVRLDYFLAEYFQLGRRHAKSSVQEGLVEVNQRLVRKAAWQLTAGDNVSVTLPPLALIADEGAPLQIHLETPNFVVVEKPSGLATAPLSTRERGTLANALVAHYPEMQGVGFHPREPGLLHRLDTGTSGLVVAARNQEAFLHLRTAADRNELKKRYSAIVTRKPKEPSGSIERALGPAPKPPGSVQVQKSGYPAFCDYRWLGPHPLAKSPAPAHLLEVQLYRAYRHQVRVHLAWLGSPILGDERYGGEPFERLALHASGLTLDAGPGYEYELSSNLPKELID